MHVNLKHSTCFTMLSNELFPKSDNPLLDHKIASCFDATLPLVLDASSCVACMSSAEEITK